MQYVLFLFAHEKVSSSFLKSPIITLSSTSSSHDTADLVLSNARTSLRCMSQKGDLLTLTPSLCPSLLCAVKCSIPAPYSSMIYVARTSPFSSLPSPNNITLTCNATVHKIATVDRDFTTFNFHFHLCVVFFNGKKMYSNVNFKRATIKCSFLLLKLQKSTILIKKNTTILTKNIYNTKIHPSLFNSLCEYVYVNIVKHRGPFIFPIFSFGHQQ